MVSYLDQDVRIIYSTLHSYGHNVNKGYGNERLIKTMLMENDEVKDTVHQLTALSDKAKS